MPDPTCKCGHPALDHHGTDGREHRDAGCQTRTMHQDWCRCPLTATQVIAPQPRRGAAMTGNTIAAAFTILAAALTLTAYLTERNRR